MESVNYEPLWLAFAQIVVLVLSGLIYNRQKGAVDLEKRDRGAFSTLVNQALQAATSAKSGVDNLTVKHYEALAADFLTCCTKLGKAETRIASLEESVASLSNKLASRERADKSAEKRAAKEVASEPAPDMPTAPGAAGVDDLVRKGVAIPLSPQLPAPVAKRRPFGQPL